MKRFAIAFMGVLARELADQIVSWMRKNRR